MKKIVLCMLLGLSANLAFSSSDVIPQPEDSAKTRLKAFKDADKNASDRATLIDQGLKDHPEQSLSWIENYHLTKNFVKLEFSGLEKLVNANPDFFKTQPGVGLLYSWTLNQFKNIQTPNYVGRYFGFEKHFSGLVSSTDLDQTAKDFLKDAFKNGLVAVDQTQELRFSFYFDHMIGSLYAIEKAREDGNFIAPSGTIPYSVISSYVPSETPIFSIPVATPTASGAATSPASSPAPAPAASTEETENLQFLKDLSVLDDADFPERVSDRVSNFDIVRLKRIVDECGQTPKHQDFFSKLSDNTLLKSNSTRKPDLARKTKGRRDGIKSIAAELADLLKKKAGETKPAA